MAWILFLTWLLFYYKTIAKPPQILKPLFLLPHLVCLICLFRLSVLSEAETNSRAVCTMPSSTGS